MGTSFVEFNGHGFWTRDPLVEALLGGIVVELEDVAHEHPWLSFALDHWALQATAGFGGCISPELDWYLPDPDRVALVCAASHRCVARIVGDDLHDVHSEAFERRAARVLGKPFEEPPAAIGGWLRHVHEAFEALLRNEIVAPPSSALFVGPTSNSYGRPPVLEVRRWLLAADRAGPSDDESAMQDLGAAVAEAADARWWCHVVKVATMPALATIALQLTTANPVSVTVIASRRGRLVTARIPEQKDAPTMTQATHVLSQLAARGWRWVPVELLSEPYDGVVESLRDAGRTWGERLFGSV